MLESAKLIKDKMLFFPVATFDQYLLYCEVNLLGWKFLFPKLLDTRADKKKVVAYKQKLRLFDY
jgi:hypothetical protein